MTDARPERVPFQAHVELLEVFLEHRAAVVDAIQGVLNAQRKPSQYLQDRPLLTRHLEDCFFTLTAVTEDQSRLKGELERAHRTSGFTPREVPGLYNDLIHPAEMSIRGFHCWRQTRWPGRNGRVRYAHTLFNVYLLRCFELLSMRVWDAGSDSAADRLAQVQDLLDALWQGSPADQPVIVRDARWLIPLAQSPTTDDLAAYLEVAERIAASFTAEDRIEIVKAGVRMIAGHLRSQIRHYCVNEGVSVDEHSVVQRTRTSNALDFALLVQGLVPLLEAYERACDSSSSEKRLELAGVICQSISPDPELLLNRLDLLVPYSMIEHVFITTDSDGHAEYTPMGRRHLRLLQEYSALIGRLGKPLSDDHANFRPVDGTYSPYGAIYGTPSNLTEDIALKTLQLEAVTRFTLEDVFEDGDADKLAWVNGWRQLPHVDREVQKQYEYPQQFAADIFDRIEHALRRAGSDAQATDVPETGRIFIVAPAHEPASESRASRIADLPVRYIGSSDRQLVADKKAEAYDHSRLQHGRQEGYFVVSYETSLGWAAVKKDFLSEIPGAGHDVRIVGLPRAAAGVLRLMCPDLIALENDVSDQASVPPSMLNA